MERFIETVHYKIHRKTSTPMTDLLSRFLVVLLLISLAVTGSNAIVLSSDASESKIQVENVELRIFPKSPAGIPLQSTYNLKFVDSICEWNTSLSRCNSKGAKYFDDGGYQTILGSSSETLSSGVLHTTIRSEITFGVNKFYEVYETFSGETVAQVVGIDDPIRVFPEMLYYSLSIPGYVQENPFSTSLRLRWRFTACGIDLTADGNPFESTIAATSTTFFINDANMNYNFTVPAFVVVDDVDSPLDLIPFFVRGEDCSTCYAAVFLPIPSSSVIIPIQIKTSTSKAVYPPVVKGTPGWKKAALGVGIVFGMASLFAVIAVGTYLFCYGPWLSAWAVISLPARKVIRYFKLLHRPPAPVFDNGVTYDEDEDDDDEEDGLLAEERVDPGELMKQGLMAAVSKPRQGVLKKLTYAMGRRLSNFIGWEGAPKTEASESQSEKKSRKANQAERRSNIMARQLSQTIAKPGVELESSIASAVLGVARGDSKTDASETEELLTTREASPTPPRLARNLDSGSSADLDLESGSRGTTPPRSKKSPGVLRGFKITAHTPQSSNVDSPSKPETTNLETTIESPKLADSSDSEEEK